METGEQPKFVPDQERISKEPDNTARAKERKAHLIRRYVENHVIALSDEQTEDLSDEFSELPTAEKANLLYDKLMSRFQALKAMRQAREKDSNAEIEPIDPYLISEIKTLWDDEATAELFCSRYGDARIETQLYKLSDLGNRYRQINETISGKEKEFETISQNLFLRKISRPDQLSATKGKAERLAKELIRLRDERQKITELEGLPPIPENTDIAAHIAYERLVGYREQLKEGFVWLDSRVDLHHQIIAALQNGRWPVLVGEVGTGKSEQADAAARALTGADPTHLACSERTSERDMISDKDIDPETGGSYDVYGPLMQAATGYEDSRQTHPAYGGRIVRFDESGLLGNQGISIIKEARQKKPGDIFFDKPVLLGFGSIWTTNPAGARYPEVNDIPSQLRREVAPFDVDYPPQTAENPELYEFMLANLIDENGHIAVSKNELVPAYEKIDFDPPQTLGQYLEHNLPGQFSKEELAGLSSADQRMVVGQEKVLEVQNDPRHGTLWRLAFAVRALQNAFDYGNDQSAPDDALKFNFTPEAKAEISDHGEPLTLATSTITLGEVSSWMRGFLDRKLKDNPDFQTDNLTDWIRFKLDNYLKQADEQDAGKIRAIFEHFHLLDAGQKTENGEPLTPREIGYLSPRVPRPLHLQEPMAESSEAPVEEAKTEPVPEAEIYSSIELMLEDGSKVLSKPENVSIISKDNRAIQLYSGNIFSLSGEKVRFKGIVDDSDPKTENHRKPIIEIDIDSGGGLHRVVEASAIAEQGRDFWSLEKLTTEEIEKQLTEWKTVYEKLGLTGFNLPTKEELMAYLYDNPEFIELLKTKEQQGFTKMVIAPLELKPIIDKLNLQIRACGGSDAYLLDTWKAMLADESKIKYRAGFTTDSNGKIILTGGKTMDQMKASPEEYGILNDCFVSFVKERQNLPKNGDTDEVDATGRVEIKGGHNAKHYLDTYFSGHNPHYFGEEAMLPQEWLALFADDLYQKYMKDNRQMPGGSSATDLLDSETITWFTSTHFPGRGSLPAAFWNSVNRRPYFYVYGPDDTNDVLAPGPSVRKLLKL